MTTRRKSFGAQAMGTVKQLHGAGMHHAPKFNAVLPRTMQKLVDEGLFVADANSEGGYRITSLGIERLKQLEQAGEDDYQPHKGS